MSVAELKNTVGIQKKTKALTFSEIILGYKSQIAMALPKHLNADRMARIALTEFSKNPKLKDCTPQSIFASIIQAAQLGLEPGIMGQAYLIPFYDDREKKMICTFVPGWQGLVDLVSRTGRASVSTDVVREGDEFFFEKGIYADLKHVPDPEGDDEKPFMYVYAVGWIRDAQKPVFEVMSRTKVERHLKRYNKVGSKHYALANENNLEMYGRKIALLQVIKYLPKSIELQTAAEINTASETGNAPSLDSVLDGNLLPAPQEEEVGPQAVVEAPNLSPEMQKVSEAFTSLQVPTGQQALLLQEYAGRLPDLLAKLNTMADEGQK